MLKSFKIKNFKSILDETISMEHNIRLPNGYRDLDTIVFMENHKMERFIPLLMIFGANASGKSNLIEAVQVFKKVLKNGIESNFFPNKLNRKYNTTAFEVSFSLNNSEYAYTLEYNENSILKEELLKNGKHLFSINSTFSNNNNVKELTTAFDIKNIAQKGYGENELHNVFSVECCFNIRHIKSFLWKIVDKYPGLSDFLRDAREYLSQQIVGAMSNNLSPFWYSDEQENEKELFGKITDIIKRLDIDISRFETKKELFNPQKSSKEQFLSGLFTKALREEERIISYHKDTKGQEVQFDFMSEESTGTKRLFGLIGMFLVALEKGQTVFIDELDASLHPFLVSFLIRMFKDKKINTHNAQLIMTTHNPYAMEEDFVRVSDVAFTNKTLNAGTTLQYLYTFENVRNTTDFVKQYLEKRLTGIPLIY
ncbi:MAG: ATP-binding protein [Elusimicrobiota bacterium]|jgi:AAA15 family ATPase/GTPase|nr:ATP-binding protein [Elusimicrobiota bacterium]